MRMSSWVRIALSMASIAIGVSTGLSAEPAAEGRNLISNGSLDAPAADGRSPLGFELEGDAIYGALGNEREPSGRGVRLISGNDRNRDGQRAGSLAITVRDLPREAGRWFRLRIEG